AGFFLALAFFFIAIKHLRCLFARVIAGNSLSPLNIPAPHAYVVDVGFWLGGFDNSAEITSKPIFTKRRRHRFSIIVSRLIPMPMLRAVMFLKDHGLLHPSSS